MNTQEPEPISGPGILWAINAIQKRFEKAKFEEVSRPLEIKEAEELPPNPTEQH